MTNSVSVGMGDTVGKLVWRKRGNLVSGPNPTQVIDEGRQLISSSGDL